jgi:hypothetical protein
MSKSKRNRKATNQTPAAQAEPEVLDEVQEEVSENAEEAPEVEKPKRITKKSVTIDLLEKDGGTTIEEIAKGYANVCGDPDMEKNKRVARLWISKIGFAVEITKSEEGVKFYSRKK